MPIRLPPRTEVFRDYLSHAGASPQDWEDLLQRTALLRGVQNQNPRLEEVAQRLKERWFVGSYKPIGTLGSLLPELATTRSGLDLSEVALRAGQRATHYNPGSRHILINPNRAHYEELVAEDLDPLAGLAASLGHEVVHAAQHAKRGDSGRAFQLRKYTAPALSDRLGVARMLPGGVRGLWERGEISPRESAIINTPLETDIPYMRQPHEIAARKGSAPIARALLEGRRGPLLGVAAVPGLVDALHNWSLDEGTNPFSEFARGAVNTTSPTGNIPSSRDVAGGSDWLMRALASSDPTVRNQIMQFAGNTAEGLTTLLRNALLDPVGTVRMLMRATQQNPAYAAGSAMAMALPMPGEFSKMAKGEAARASEDLARRHVADWNVRQYEGEVGPLTPTNQLDELGAWLENNPDHPAWNARYKQYQSMHGEGGGEVGGSVWTREERGAEELRKLGIGDVDNITGSTGQPWEAFNPRNPKEVRGFATEQEAREFVEREKGNDPLFGDGWDYAPANKGYVDKYLYDNAQTPRDIAEGLTYEFPNAPIGQRMWRNGDEWVHTKRGWTKDVDAIKPKGSAVPQSIIHQMARVLRDEGAEKAVAEGVRHGGLPQRDAANLIAATLSHWRAAGMILQPEQLAWLEIHRSTKRKPQEPK